MKVVGVHRTALSRQVGEAVRIVRRGLVLNSRSEFNRCSISRLSLEQVRTPDTIIEEQLAEGQGEEDLTTDWTEHLLAQRDRADQESRQILGKVRTVDSHKRKDVEGDILRSKKRRKYALVEEGWGEQEENKNKSSFLYSGLENTVVLEQCTESVAAPRTKLNKIVRGAENVRKITEWVIHPASRVGEGSPKPPS